MTAFVICVGSSLLSKTADVTLICLISLISKIETNSKIHIGMHNIQICKIY